MHLVVEFPCSGTMKYFFCWEVKENEIFEHFIITGRYVCLFPKIIDDKSILFMLLLKDQSR